MSSSKTKAQTERFFAHSTDNPDKVDWQPLAEHLQNVGDLAAEKARCFGGEDMARIAGLLHDLGKYTLAFQNRLEGDPSRVDHSTWGAQIAQERYGPLGTLLAYGIAGHHAGLANGRASQRRSSLQDRLQKTLPELDPCWEQEIQLPAQAQPPNFKRNNANSYFQCSFFGRMLFSCLVDADYLDTEQFYLHAKNTANRRSQIFPSMAELKTRLDTFLEQRFGSKGDDKANNLNQIRSQILSHARTQAAQDPGLFSLNVPTGGGKTLSSLAFALEHAVQHGLRRIILVAPFNTIIEQNAQVWREALGDQHQEFVLEHHSHFIDDPQTQPEAKAKLQHAMENWEAPIIVTSAVQFFESCFADRPSRCRKLHNIAGSVIVLDEAQTLPLKPLKPCIALIAELALNYNTSLVLCTATQPALKQQDDFPQGLENVREIAPNPEGLHRSLKRVGLRHLGTLSDDELIQHLSQEHQVLCILNNRRHTRSLYEQLQALPGTLHLSTLMHAKHRSAVLKKVRVCLEQQAPCRVISTSLVEAGVDIDFPSVYRAEAGLDSIAQAAGRCNRESRWPAAECSLKVFQVGSDWPMPVEIKQCAQATRSLFRQFGNEVLSLEALHQYFKEVYWQKGQQALDAQDLLKQIEEGGIDGIPYDTLATQFRIIESPLQPIIVPYDDTDTDTARQALAELKQAEYPGRCARALQPYLVQVPKSVLDALTTAGAVQSICPERFGTQFLELINLDLYDPSAGLKLDDPTFMKTENLII